MNPHSPVSVLDALLQEAACKRESTGEPGNQRTGWLPTAPRSRKSKSRPEAANKIGSQTGLQARVLQPRKGPLTCVGGGRIWTCDPFVPKQPK